MKSKPRISIVTPNFNKAEYIGDAMDSVIQQNYSNKEYIVIDGGSTDGSLNEIKDRILQIDYWESKSDKGMYHAIDKGFQQSSGDIMTYINSDDELKPGTLELVAHLFERFPEVNWITGIPNFINQKGQQVYVHTEYDLRWSKYRFFFRPLNLIQQEGTFWRRSLWEKAGGYMDKNLKYAGDYELWSRFFLHAELYTVQTILASNRKYGAGQITHDSRQEYQEELEQVYHQRLQQLSAHDHNVLCKIRKLKQLQKKPLRRALDKPGTKLEQAHAFPPVMVYNLNTNEFELKG